MKPYLGIQVNDSEVVNSSEGATMSQDFVGFVLDGQPMAKKCFARLSIFAA